MLLVGPDGTGKSTTAELLASSATADVRVTGHYRPGILWKRSPVATVTPHADPGRSTPTAVLKLTAVFVDFVLGYLGPWRRSGRTGVVVLERGWWDHLADPVRYRLPRSLRRWVELLARLLPKADLVVVLSGDPAAIVARKPELSEAEVEAQLTRWVELAPRAGRRVMTQDTVAYTPAQVVLNIERALRETSRTWMAVPGTPARNRIMATVGVGGWAALQIYRPNSRTARLLVPVRWVAVRMGWGARRVPDPVLELLPALAGIEGTVSMAAMTSPGRDRTVVGLATAQGLHSVAKVGSLDDHGLRREAAVLARFRESDPGLRVPVLRFAGDADGRFVVITDAVRHSGPPVGRGEIDPVLADLDRVGLVHGDFAPWNLVRERCGELVVLDFEHAWWGSDPGFDLCHFLVQCGALLGAGHPADVVEDLRRSLGGDTREVVRHYCQARRRRADASNDELRFMDELERAALTERRPPTAEE